MVTNRKVTGKAISMPLGILVGLAISVVITLAATAIIANLILAEKVGEGAIGYGAIVTMLLSSAAGSWISAVLVRRRWMITCVAVGGTYFLTLLAITALFFGGQYQGVAVSALVIFAGSGAVGLLGLKAGGEGRKRRRVYRSR